MTDFNPHDADLRDEVYLLADACVQDALTDEMLQRLEELVRGNPTARQYYVDFLHDAYQLHRMAVLSSATDDAAADFGVGDEAFSAHEGFISPVVPPIEIRGGWQGMGAYFSQVGPLSYLLAVVITGAMLLVGWAYKISHYPGMVKSPPTVQRDITPELVFVGRVTGMKDCRWADPETQTYTGASVPLGRNYALSAGLMEITYDGGAKVILEGPCRYQVESAAGGYLALGKLTAKVEKKEIGGLAASAAGAKPQAANPKSPSSFILHPSALFSVRTPTAIVADLGTEFGVEVSRDGNTVSRVFLGAVRVQAVGDNLPSPTGSGAGGEGSVVLHANETARVEKNITGVVELLPRDKAGVPPQFVRRLYQPPTELDLLDIVAGGNGLGRLRGSGIDQTSGIRQFGFSAEWRHGDGQYRPVYWQELIDGVFVPDGRNGCGAN